MPTKKLMFVPAMQNILRIIGFPVNIFGTIWLRSLLVGLCTIIITLFSLFPDESSAQNTAFEPITIQLRWAHQFQFAGYYAAKEKGYYAEEGLDVTLFDLDSADGLLASVLAGKAQYGVGDSGLLRVRAKGAPVVLLAQIFQHSQSVLLTRRDSGILDPYSLKGKKVMTTLTDLDDATLQAMFLQTIGSLESITFIPHSNDPLELKTGRVDAVSGYLSNELLRMNQSSVPVNIIDPRSYGIDFYGDNLFTTEKEISDNPERVAKVIRATLRGWQYALKHKDEIIELILKNYAPDLDQAQLAHEAKVIDQMITPDLIPIGNINPERYKSIAQTYQQLGMIDTGSVPAGFLYDEEERKIRLNADERIWLKTHPKIVLGIGASWKPRLQIDKDGTLSGMSVDFINLLNKKLGANIQLKAGRWHDIVELAKAREIDGLAASTVGEDRRAFFNFSKSYQQIHKYVFIRTGADFEISGLQDLQGRKVAVQKENRFANSIAMQIDGAKIREFSTELECLEQMVKGEVDAAIASLSPAQFEDRGLSAVIKIAYMIEEYPLQLVYSIRKDWPELIGILNKGVAAITEEERARILRKQMGNAPSNVDVRPNLTTKERAWLDQEHTVRVRVADWPPFGGISEDAVWGISVDYLRLISRRTGLRLEFIAETRSFHVAFESMKNGQGPDLIQNMVNTPERKDLFLFSQNYYSAPRVIYTRTDIVNIRGIEDLRGKTVAAKRGTVLTEQLSERYPDVHLQFHDSEEQCLKAVAQRKADAFIGNLTLGTYLIMEQGLLNLKVTGPSPFEDHVLSFCSRKDWPELNSILDKGLDTISPAERAAIRNKYLSVRYDHGIRIADVLKWVLLVVVTASGILALFVFWNKSLQKQVQERTVELTATNKSLAFEISDRRQAEDELLKSEAKYRDLVDNSLVGIFTTTLDGQYLFVNDAMVKMYEFDSPEQMLAKGSVYRWYDRKQRERFLAKLQKHGSVNNFEAETLTHSDLNIYVLISAKMEKDNISAMVMDITKRKQAEMKIFEHQERLKALASQLTIAEENERRRIATELHDHIGQDLAFSRIQVAKAKKYAEEGKLTTILNDLSQSLLGNIQNTKELVFDLSSPMLDELGLVAAISNWLNEKVGNKHGIKTEFYCSDRDFELSKDLRSILFRNVRELLINVIKHAQATNVIVSLDKKDAELNVTIHDDGVGFDSAQKIDYLGSGSGMRFGLFSIGERLEAFGGSLEILSETGKGCKIIMTVPLFIKDDRYG